MKADIKRFCLLISSILVAAACGDEDDTASTRTQVNATMEPIVVAVTSGGDASVPSTGAEIILTSESGAALLATVFVSPVVVPISFGDISGDEAEHVAVRVQVEETYVSSIDEVELSIVPGGTEDEDPLDFLMERDALEPSVFFLNIKPGCSSGERDENGVCILDVQNSCTTVAGTFQGRCDQFSVTLWADVLETEEETPSIQRFGGSESEHWRKSSREEEL